MSSDIQYHVDAGLATIGNNIWGSIELNLPSDTNFRDVLRRLVEVEKRLAILEPNQELHEKFPALQEAYDHYKLIEKLVYSQSKTEI